MSIKRLLATATTALALSLASCAAPLETGLAETPPAGAIPGPALWQLSDEDTTIYLFGTVHVLPDGINWFDPRVERAFAASDTLVTEVDVSNQEAMAVFIAEAATLQGGQTLRGLMSEEDRSEYEVAIAALGWHCWAER